MSQNDPIPIEYKTIRLPAAAYYKLVELSGLIAAIRGESASISEVAATGINELHHGLFPLFLKIVNDQKELQKWRNHFVHNKKQLSDLMQNAKIVE